MAMRLTPAILRDMADALDKVEDLGFDVNEIKVGGHKVKLDTASNGSSMKVVVGITTGEWSHGTR